MTMWQMYWLVKLSDIGCLFVGVGVISVIVFCVLWVSWVFADIEDNNTWKSTIKRATPIAFIVGFSCLLIGTFIPTTKQMAAIIVVPKIVNNEQIQNIGENGLSILEKQTAEWLKDISGSTKKPPQ